MACHEYNSNMGFSRECIALIERWGASPCEIGILNGRACLMDNVDVDQLKQLLRHFAKQRDWDKFHNPKNLAMALACESGELLEIFRWSTEAEANAAKHDKSMKEQVAHELADVLLNVIRLSDLMDINLTEAIMQKININEKKYPADLVRGSAKKQNHVG